MKVPRTLWVIEGIHAFRDVVLGIAIRKPIRHDEVEVVIRAKRRDALRGLRDQLKGEPRGFAGLVGDGKCVYARHGVFRKRDVNKAVRRRSPLPDSADLNAWICRRYVAAVEVDAREEQRDVAVFCVQPPGWRLAAGDLWRRRLCGVQHACIKAQAGVLRGIAT